MTAKTSLVVGIALVVALGAGYFWGSSGRSQAQQALRVATLQQELAEGRAAILDARLDIYSVNFGEASRHFELSRAWLTRAVDHLKELDRTDDAARIAAAMTGLDDAQRLAGNLDQTANARAADVAAAVAQVIAAGPPGATPKGR